MVTNAKEVWQWATVTRTQAMTPDIREITIAVDIPAPAAPGSHVDVAIARERGGDLRRSYSIVRALSLGDELTFAVLRRAGSLGGSRYMHELEPGQQMRVTQPLQNFPLRIGAAHYVLVAGGVGITAVAAMADKLRALDVDYRLVYLSRSADTTAYLAPLRHQHGERMQTFITTEGHRLDAPAFVSSLAQGTELYVCGPIRLMDALRRAWAQDHRDESLFRYETFGNSGWFEPEPFVVRVPRLGVTATITPDRSILETLEDAGVEVMSDCRRGECGLCEVKVLAATGDLEHRDVFYSDRQKAMGGKLCACVSRVVSSGTDRGTSRGASIPEITIDFG